jgi:hypothetical protein
VGRRMGAGVYTHQNTQCPDRHLQGKITTCPKSNHHKVSFL